MKQFKYIDTNPLILQGKPCIIGTRISVEFILDLVASGASINDIHQNYPHLDLLAIQEAIEFAKYRLKSDSIITVPNAM